MGKYNALWILFLHNLRFTKWEERDLNHEMTFFLMTLFFQFQRNEKALNKYDNFFNFS